MAPLTAEQLERLKASWRRAGAPIVDHLEPGLTRDAIDAAFAPYEDLEPPEELYTWWGWHNGAAGHMLGGDREFLSLEAALAFYEDIQPGVPSVLLPVTTDRPWFHIECLQYSSQTGRIVGFDVGEPLEIWLPSLGELVETWIGFIEQGIWKYDATSYFQPVAMDDLPRGHPAFNVG